MIWLIKSRGGPNNRVPYLTRVQEMKITLPIQGRGCAGGRQRGRGGVVAASAWRGRGGRQQRGGALWIHVPGRMKIKWCFLFSWHRFDGQKACRSGFRSRSSCSTSWGGMKFVLAVYITVPMFL
jgi:hypothetical protein